MVLIFSLNESRGLAPLLQVTPIPSLSPQPSPSLSIIERLMDLEASHRELTSATLCCLGSDTTNEVQIAGDATKWLLGLRDGRSLVLPVVCPCGSGVTPGIDDMGQAIVMVNGRDSPEVFERWSDEDDVAD
jgi:hypothetical protein